MGIEQKSKITWWQPGMQLFLRLSGWIGGPVIVAVFVGKYFDRKLDSTPWIFLFCVGMSFIISTTALIYIGLKEMKRIEEEDMDKNPKSK